MIQIEGIAVTTTHNLMQRLRENEELRQELAQLLVDHFLDTPINQLIDPSEVIDSKRLASLMSNEIKSLVRKPETERWVYEEVRDLLSSGEELEGPLRNHIPDGLIEPIKELLHRDYRADPELVRAVVDHPTMRIVIRGVMEETLIEFANRVSNWMPDPGSFPGGKGFFEFFLRMFGMARRFTKRFSEAVEKQIETRAEELVDDMIDQMIDGVINQLTSEQLTSQLSTWRVDLVDSFLDQPVQRYREEFLKLDPEKTVSHIGNILRAFSRSEQLEEYTQLFLIKSLELSSNQSIRDILENSSWLERWKPWLEQTLSEQLDRLLQNEDIREWLSETYPEEGSINT